MTQKRKMAAFVCVLNHALGHTNPRREVQHVRVYQPKAAVPSKHDMETEQRAALRRAQGSAEVIKRPNLSTLVALSR